MIVLPAQPRILVVALRRLGDVLLTTPLIRSLKRAYPDAMIDALVFRGTEGILSGNSDLANVIALGERSSLESLTLLYRMWRAYDLAISTQTGDRPTLFAWVAGKQSAGFVEGAGAMPRTKRMALGVPVETEAGTHRVTEVLRLADALGIPGVSELVPPQGAQLPGVAENRAYAVIHAAPMYHYKQWTPEGWRALAAALNARGLTVIATGGPADQPYLDDVWSTKADLCRVDGALTWPELAALMRGARIYVGPDTSMTHLATATGAPTVALYGPTDPRLYGPWPTGGLDTSWEPAGTLQKRNNVWLVQDPAACPYAIFPCQQEGCLRRRDSHSQCLDALPVSQVLAAVDAALAAGEPTGRRSGARG